MSTEPTPAPPAANAESPAPSQAPANERGGLAPVLYDKAKTAPPKFPRKGVPQQPRKMSKGLLIVLTGLSIIIVAVIYVVSAHMAMPLPEAEVPRLDDEFTDPINSYSIRRPMGWRLEDPHDKSNIYLKGPREPGFSPLIIGSLDLAPGSLAGYVQLHKSRIEFQDKTVAWVSEDMGESIDGCPHTARLEYDSTVEVENVGPVRVRTLQYIMEDKPRFYRVTCHVAANLYEKYLPKFEASVRSFRRQPLGRAHPSMMQK